MYMLHKPCCAAVFQFNFNGISERNCTTQALHTAPTHTQVHITLSIWARTGTITFPYKRPCNYLDYRPQVQPHATANNCVTVAYPSKGVHLGPYRSPFHQSLLSSSHHNSHSKLAPPPPPLLPLPFIRCSTETLLVLTMQKSNVVIFRKLELL